MTEAALYQLVLASAIASFYLLGVGFRVYSRTSMKHPFVIYLGGIMACIGLVFFVYTSHPQSILKVPFLPLISFSISLSGYTLLVFGAYYLQRQEWADAVKKHGKAAVSHYGRELKGLSLVNKLLGNYPRLMINAKKSRKGDN
jgi:hypothetical protein